MASPPASRISFRQMLSTLQVFRLSEFDKALAHSQTLTGLKRLYLCSNGIGDEGAKALSNSDNLKSLRVLSIWRNEIRDAGGEAIASSKTFGNLERLYMSLNLMERPVRKIIRGSDLAKQLKTLVMD